ncbi:hypothetical protein [Burkholderia sp. JKS000303]|uniref:hypothetical protein n=1 Tax=Burkholderia sp. JKS000303 TaxID=1938747 RepID=UPI000C0010D7|nr:hypothetical protein [Burkholderia sp. JKS000303]PFH12713.1 hypothetical protein BX604_7523 [Burkholderia sp. JKS000303]
MPYDRLRASDLATQYLSGVFRQDGVQFDATTQVTLDGVDISSAEYAQLLMIFNGARVHAQAEYELGSDLSPPFSQRSFNTLTKIASVCIKMSRVACHFTLKMASIASMKMNRN